MISLERSFVTLAHVAKRSQPQALCVGWRGRGTRPDSMTAVILGCTGDRLKFLFKHTFCGGRAALKDEIHMRLGFASVGKPKQKQFQAAGDKLETLSKQLNLSYGKLSSPLFHIFCDIQAEKEGYPFLVFWGIILLVARSDCWQRGCCLELLKLLMGPRNSSLIAVITAKETSSCIISRQVSYLSNQKDFS